MLFEIIVEECNGVGHAAMANFLGLLSLNNFLPFVDLVKYS